MSTNFHHPPPPPPPSSPQSPPPYSAPPVILTLTIVVLVFFFAGIFAIYICRCFMAYLLNSSNIGRSPIRNAVQPTGSATNGLDASIIATFPTFVYSSVKDLRQGKCGLECAVCLAEFEDDDELRLLTACNHVFHPDCIDLWFENHTTCPLCRTSLLPPEKSPENNVTTTPEMNNDQPESEREVDNNNVSIENEEEGEEQENEEVVLVVEERDEHGGGTSSPIATKNVEQGDKDKVAIKRYPRWHSTGHSIIHVDPDPNDERYTLKLPDHIKEHIARGHNWTGSCTVFGDFSNNAGYRKGGGLAELSGFSGGDVTRV